MYLIIADVSQKMDGFLSSGEIQPISGVCTELKNRSLTRSPPSKPLGIKPKNSPIDKRFKKSATVTSDQTSGEYIKNFMEILKTTTIFQQNVLTNFSTRNVNFSEHKKAKPLGTKPKNSQIDKRFKKTVTSDQKKLASANPGEFQLKTFMIYLFFQHNVLTKFSCPIFQCIKKKTFVSMFVQLFRMLFTLFFFSFL